MTDLTLDTAVRALMAEFVGLYNEGDADGIAGVYAEDSHRFDAFGGHADGREAVRVMYREEIARRGAEAKNSPGQELELDINIVLPLSASQALVDGLIRFRGRRRRFTAVARRDAEGWRLQLGRVHPPAEAG